MGKTEPAGILILDREELVRFTIASVLRVAGYRAIEVHSKAAALKSLGDGDPDIVMVDAGLPKRMLRETMAAIRERAPGVKLIGIVNRFDLDKGKGGIPLADFGPDYLLIKPFSPEALQRCVAECLKTDA